MVVVMVDKFLKTQIVECSSVIKWVFSDDMKPYFSSFYLWEIIHSTVNRMGKQVDKVKNEYNQLNERYKKSSLEPDSVFISISHNPYNSIQAFNSIVNLKNQVHGEITEEEIDQKLATLNTLRDQQKELFYLIIERFVTRLNDSLANPEERASHLHKWSIERFEDILLTVN